VPASNLSAVVAPAPGKPRLRGVLHQWACIASLATGALLVLVADGSRARIAAGVYALSVTLLLGTSAVYHRVDWRTAAARRRMRRLDHTMIFVLIAGTYTPFALLVLHGELATAILIAVWSCVIAGAVLKLLWVDAPKALMAAIYVALGLVSVVTLPQMLDRLGVAAVSVIALGGVLYLVGAVIYALRRPDPSPTVFGYHELFHLLVVLAAVCFYVVVVAWVL
jgi:hemolysin III